MIDNENRDHSPRRFQLDPQLARTASKTVGPAGGASDTGFRIGGSASNVKSHSPVSPVWSTTRRPISPEVPPEVPIKLPIKLIEVAREPDRNIPSLPGVA
jgi:hypothetical protein